MNSIKKAENYISTLAPHVKKREAALIIIELIEDLKYTKILVEETKALYQDELNIIGLELEKQQEVIGVIKDRIVDSYYGHEEVNLTPVGRVAIEEALAALEKGND